MHKKDQELEMNKALKEMEKELNINNPYNKKNQEGENKFLNVWTILLLTVVGIIIVMLMPSTPLPPEENIAIDTTTKTDSIDSAYRLCEMLDSTGRLSKPCEISGWEGSVDITVDLSSGEARLICQTAVKRMKELENLFDTRWVLKIYSPYSNGNTIATCKLSN